MLTARALRAMSPVTSAPVRARTVAPAAEVTVMPMVASSCGTETRSTHSPAIM